MAERVRTIDRINTGPRFSEAEAVQLNRLFRGTDTVEMLGTVLREGDAHTSHQTTIRDQL